MNSFNKKQYWAIKNHFDKVDNTTTQSGIYLWSRVNKNNILCTYVGQAENIKERKFDYYAVLSGITYPTKHFEASLKFHKSDTNPWKHEVLELCPIDKLDEREKYWIEYYDNKEYCNNYNTIYASHDKIRTTAKKYDKYLNVYKERFSTLLKRLNIEINENNIIINMKKNKDNTNNKLSEDALFEIKEELKELIK